MPNIKVHRRLIALTVGALLALMPLASYAQTPDHAAAELANSKARCQMVARGEKVPGHPTDCARFLKDPPTSQASTTSQASKAPTCPVAGRSLNKREQETINTFEIAKAKAIAKRKPAPTPSADVVALEAC
jgi:hypothetical protein